METLWLAIIIALSSYQIGQLDAHRQDLKLADEIIEQTVTRQGEFVKQVEKSTEIIRKELKAIEKSKRLL